MKRLYTGRGISCPDDGGPRRALDVLHPDRAALLEPRGQAPVDRPEDRLAWTWQATKPVAADVTAYELDEHEMWSQRESDAPPATIKAVSFMVRRDGMTVEEFRGRYREHAKVAHEHHLGCSRYVQNDVVGVAGTGALEIDGVSELWFPTRTDFVDRYWGHGQASATAVRADVTSFVDLTRTFWLVVVPGEP
jgi:hypothetical protein